MILYNISIHTLFHSEGFKCLSVCQSIWIHLRRAATHSAKDFFLLVAQWMGVEVNLSWNDFFFVMLHLLNDGSGLKHGFHSSRISEKVFSLISFDTPSSVVSPSQWNRWLLWVFLFFLTRQEVRTKFISLAKGAVALSGLMEGVGKMKKTTGYMTQPSKPGRHTHKHNRLLSLCEPGSFETGKKSQ